MKRLKRNHPLQHERRPNDRRTAHETLRDSTLQAMFVSFHKAMPNEKEEEDDDEMEVQLIDEDDEPACDCETTFCF